MFRLVPNHGINNSFQDIKEFFLKTEHDAKRFKHFAIFHVAITNAVLMDERFERSAGPRNCIKRN